METTERTWTVLGLWIEDEPVSVGVIEGDHPVYGGSDADDYQGPWAHTVQAPTADEAEGIAKDCMTATLGEDDDQ